MQVVPAFITYDNKVHMSEEAAIRHLNAVYANKLCSLARNAILISKYSLMCEFIDQHLFAFADLQCIKADLEIKKDDPDDF